MVDSVLCCLPLSVISLIKIAIVIGPAIAITVVANTLMMLVFMFRDLVLVYYTLVRTPILGPFAKTLAVIFIIIPLATWPAIVICGSVFWGIGVSFFGPIAATFSDELCGGFFETIEFAVKGCRDFYSFETRTISGSLQLLRLRQCDDPFEIDFLGFLCMPILLAVGALVDGCGVAILACIKFPFAFLHGGYYLVIALFSAGPMLLLCCSPLALLAIALYPAICAAGLGICIAGGFFVGLSAAVVGLKYGPVEALRFTMRMLRKFDKASNALAFASDSSCLPKMPARYNSRNYSDPFPARPPATLRSTAADTKEADLENGATAAAAADAPSDMSLSEPLSPEPPSALQAAPGGKEEEEGKAAGTAMANVSLDPPSTAEDEGEGGMTARLGAALPWMPFGEETVTIGSIWDGFFEMTIIHGTRMVQEGVLTREQVGEAAQETQLGLTALTTFGVVSRSVRMGVPGFMLSTGVTVDENSRPKGYIGNLMWRPLLMLKIGLFQLAASEEEMRYLELSAATLSNAEAMGRGTAPAVIPADAERRRALDAWTDQLLGVATQVTLLPPFERRFGGSMRQLSQRVNPAETSQLV